MTQRLDNIIGALALGMSDAMMRQAQTHAPELGPAAAALVLLGHEPGMTIERLRRSLGLSHPGAVRLADRLVEHGLVVRNPSAADRRAVALHLTGSGEATCRSILDARDGAIKRAMTALTETEQATFGTLAEKLLRVFVADLDHAYAVCRLCDYEACTDCPVDAELVQRGADTRHD